MRKFPKLIFIATFVSTTKKRIWPKVQYGIEYIYIWVGGRCMCTYVLKDTQTRKYICYITISLLQTFSEFVILSTYTAGICNICAFYRAFSILFQSWILTIAVDLYKK